jgi:xanthine dehydrogenase accessory factor
MPARLMIVGSGDTAERLAELGGRLGYHEVRLLSDLPDDATAEDHLVIAEDDPERGRPLLAKAAQAAVLPAYLGFAAPHREGCKAIVQLALGRVPKDRLQHISAPAGVDVGAETPDEVAISVAAELVAIRRGRPRPSDGSIVDAPTIIDLPGAQPRPPGARDDADKGRGRN